MEADAKIAALEAMMEILESNYASNGAKVDAAHVVIRLLAL